MINLLIISPYYIPFAGVGANRIKSLINSLINDGSFNIFLIKNSTGTYGNNVINGESIPKEINVIECDTTGIFVKDKQIYKSKVKEVFNKYKIEKVLITVGPFFTLPLVSQIKKNYNVPVYLDIRDFWAHEPVTKDLQSGIMPLLKSLIKDLLFERKAIMAATKIIVMGNADKLFLCEVYGKKIEKKIYAITNGYDDAALKEYVSIDTVEKYSSDTINICVYGKFAAYLSDTRVKEFASALRTFGKSHHLNIIQYGNKEERLERILSDYEVDYECKGYFEYARGVRLLQSSSNILLLSSDLEGVGLGTKIYDYIFCNKPIIFIGSKTTALAGFVSSFKNGFVCSNEMEVLKSLETIVNKEICTLDENIDIYSFSRGKQNQKYIDLLKQNLFQGE